MLCRKIANFCDGYAFYLCSGMDIRNSCFICLVQDAPVLPVCRVLGATATVLPGMNPLQYNASLKSRCRISAAVLYLGDRPPVTAIPAAGLPDCSSCVYNTLKSAELRTEIQGLVEWIFRIFDLSLIPTRSNRPERLFLRGVYPLKVSPL